MAKTIRNRTERKTFKRSTIAACVMAVSAVHAQAQDTTDNPEILEEVVVYGIKQSLQNAQDIKRDASTVKDVITASDIGALPDKSVVEALQRIPGVAIERFEASDDPDHFSVEGGNVTVRGLNRTRAEINGRDSFSASGDGGLNFSDIAPQMVGSVEVIKSQSASMTEGAISGTINLITRKPFDKDELVAGITAKGQYSDLIEELTPEISGLISNVWETDAGKFGALLSVTSQNVKTRADGVGVFNYKPVTNAGSNPDGQNLFGPLAGSARQQKNDRDRLGVSATLQYATPSDSLTATLEFIRSDSTLSWTERFIEYPTQPFDSDASSENLNISNASYNCPQGNNITTTPCTFTSGLIAGGGNVDGFTGHPFYATGTRVRDDERIVNDISLNLAFTPNDNLTIEADFQYIDATNEIYDVQSLARLAAVDAFLDLRGSEEAQFELIGKEGATLTPDTPDSYFMRSVMDHSVDNEAEETAFQLDGEYTFDDGFITAVKSGVRVSNRTLDYQESDFNWGSLGETWMENDDTKLVKGQELVDKNYLEAVTLENHLNGHALTVNDTFYFPSADALRNTESFYDRAVEDGVSLGGGSWRPLTRRANANLIKDTPFTPAEVGTIEEDRSAFYIQLDFGNDDGDITFSGDIGLRYVSWQLTSTGADFFGPLSSDDSVFDGELRDFFEHPGNGTGTGQYWSQYHDSDAADGAWFSPQAYKDYYTDTFLEQFVAEETEAGTADPQAAAQARVDQAITQQRADRDAVKAEVESFLNRESGKTNTVKNEKFTRLLPSFNLKLGLTDDFIVRFAASESIFMPTLNVVRNSRRVSHSIDDVRVDNPDDPKYDNDERIESATLTGYTANGGGNPLLQPELSSNYDLTFEWYFDEVGSLTSSLFYKRVRDYFRQSTVIESITNTKGVTRDVAVTGTQNAGNATIQGYEVALTTSFGFLGDDYEDFGIQSSYTFIDGSANDNGITNFGSTNDKFAREFTFNNIRDLPIEGLSKDNYNLVAYYDNGTFQTRFAYNWRSRFLLNSRDAIAFAPVYGEATGQLDWSASYNISDNVKVGLEASNLLNEVTKTSIANEIDPSTSSYKQDVVNSPRSYFVNDRRFGMFVQAQF